MGQPWSRHEDGSEQAWTEEDAAGLRGGVNTAGTPWLPGRLQSTALNYGRELCFLASSSFTKRGNGAGEGRTYACICISSDRLFSLLPLAWNGVAANFYYQNLIFRFYCKCLSGCTAGHEKHWFAPLSIYLVQQPLLPPWSLSFPSYFRKKRRSGKSRKIKCDWNFPFLLWRINTIPDSASYIFYLSRNLNSMNSQVRSSLKCVAQFLRADRKWTEHGVCWKASRACELLEEYVKCPILTASEGENSPPFQSRHIPDLLEVSWKAIGQYFQFYLVIKVIIMQHFGNTIYIHFFNLFLRVLFSLLGFLWLFYFFLILQNEDIWFLVFFWVYLFMFPLWETWLLFQFVFLTN